MNRAPVCDDIGGYVLGALDGAESERFEAHLLSCPGCSDEIEYLRPLQELLLAMVGQRLDFSSYDNVDPIGDVGPCDHVAHPQRIPRPATWRTCCRGGAVTRRAVGCAYRRRC